MMFFGEAEGLRRSGEELAEDVDLIKCDVVHSNGTCVGCRNDGDCKHMESRPYCDASLQRCVECSAAMQQLQCPKIGWGVQPVPERARTCSYTGCLSRTVAGKLPVRVRTEEPSQSTQSLIRVRKG